ncbi:MAG: hypothetical protein NC483_00180 [Ruminococcus sp.]|nr:hypothetical protein [Ruminococcus sp.]
MKNALFYSGKKVLIVDDRVKPDFREAHSLTEEEVKLENEAEIVNKQMIQKYSKKSKIKKWLGVFGSIGVLGIIGTICCVNGLLVPAIYGELSLAALAISLVGLTVNNKKRKGLNSEIDYLYDRLDEIDAQKESLSAVSQEITHDLEPSFVDLSKDIEKQKVSLNRQLELLYKVGASRRKYLQLAKYGEFEDEFKDSYYSEEIDVAKRSLNKKSR